MKMRLLGTVVAVSLLGIGGHANAQSMKVAWVDLQKALTQVSDGKAAKAKLEKLVKGKQGEFDKKQDDVKRLKDELETQGAMMKEDLKRQKVQDYQRKLMELQDYYMNNQKELAEEEQKLTKPILERFERILQKLGKDEGYTMIIEKAAVVYATPAVDLTARLIKEFNSGAGKEKGGKDSSGKCHMDCLSSKADCYKKCSSGSEACESACEPAFDSCDKNCD